MKAKVIKAILLVFSTYFSYSQELSKVYSDTSDFELLYLDDRIAYLNIDTREVLTQKAFSILMRRSNPFFIDPIYEDFWDNLKVNPFKNYTLEYPFLLNFEDTLYRPPVDHKMVITSRFGRRRRGPHRGIDIDLEVGDPVRSILPGRVRFVGYSRGHGKTVVVRHNNDLETVYAHLSEYHVSADDVVRKGACLGLGGATGNARGSHLHMEVRYKGVCINPEYLMDFMEPKIYNDSLWVTKGLVDPLRHSSYSQAKYEVLNSKELAEGYDKRAQQIYVVRKGDTLWAIARRNGMTVNQLVAMNRRKISSKSTLRIGQHLIISP